MADRLRKLGGELHTATPVRSIVRDAGRVTGLVASDAKGDRVEVDAKAIIIASGGFSDNPQMIKDFTGFTYTDNNCSNGGTCCSTPSPAHA
jgi:fumarate reductase flavoprotein subunit